MLIYSNNNDNINSLFGDVSYKSAHNREQSINRAQVVQQLQRRNKRTQTKYKNKNKTKNLTSKNIKFLKSLGLQVQKH